MPGTVCTDACVQIIEVESSTLSSYMYIEEKDSVPSTVKSVKFTEEKTKETAAREFHKVLTTHQLYG